MALEAVVRFIELGVGVVVIVVVVVHKHTRITHISQISSTSSWSGETAAPLLVVLLVVLLVALVVALVVGLALRLVLLVAPGTLRCKYTHALSQQWVSWNYKSSRSGSRSRYFWSCIRSMSRSR